MDQLELAAAAEGWVDGGLLGAGAGVGAGAGAATGCGAASVAEEPVTEPNQRVRRLPLLALLDCCSSATEVLHAPGEALAVRVGGADACGGGSAPSLTLVLKSGIGSGRARALALDSPSGRTSVEKAAIAAAPSSRAAAFGDERFDLAAADLAGSGKLGIALAGQVRPI